MTLVERWTSCQTILRSIQSCAPSNGKTNSTPISIIMPYGSSRANGFAIASESTLTAMRPEAEGQRPIGRSIVTSGTHLAHAYDSLALNTSLLGWKPSHVYSL
jgi:hypothetical protein